MITPLKGLFSIILKGCIKNSLKEIQELGLVTLKTMFRFVAFTQTSSLLFGYDFKGEVMVTMTVYWWYSKLA